MSYTIEMADLHRKYPSIAALERVAKRHVPAFGYDYFTGGIGAEVALANNRKILDEIRLLPTYLPESKLTVETHTRLFGQTWDYPFGVTPIGLGGMVWPRAAEILAATAARYNIPFGMSSFATAKLEEIADIAKQNLWFQLYQPNDAKIRDDILDRAKATGCNTLIVTIDIPTATYREKEIRNGLSVPPAMNLGNILQMLRRPVWLWHTLKTGIPRFHTLTPYLPKDLSLAQLGEYLADMIEGHVTVQDLAYIRDYWPGTLIVKGVLDPRDAIVCKQLGVDGIVISNHGGRQIDAAPSSLEMLPEIRDVVGENMPLLIDGGIRSGLDIARAIAKGADFVLLGRAFMFGLSALGNRGGEHVMELLDREFKSTMALLGCPKVSSLGKHLLR
jgi:L-lactate dehydrogenase (cytochrome)